MFLKRKNVMEHFEIEKRLVEFNRNVLLANIISSDMPHKEKSIKDCKMVKILIL